MQGRLVDLTLMLGGDRLTPVPGNPTLTLEAVRTHAKDNRSSSKVSLSLHLATHVDAPYHFDSTGTNVRGRFPDDNQYYPIYEVAETYNLPVIVHAAACPADDFSMREYDLSRMVGREVDHTLAAARVFMSEIPDRFPDLKFIHCHLGGTFWASTFRYGRGEGSIESRTVEQGNEGMGPEAFQRRLKNTYFNTTFWEPRVIKYAVEALGEDQIVFGSDYPIRTNLMQNVAEAIESLDIPDSAKRKIAYENSIRIYGESLVPQQTA